MDRDDNRFDDPFASYRNTEGGQAIQPFAGAGAQSSYQVRGASQKGGIIGVLVLAVVGLAFFCIGYFMKADLKKFMDTAKRTSATISKITTSTSRTSKGKRRTTHSTYVTYEVEGKLYQDVSLGYYQSGMKTGQSIEIYYDPANPAKIKTPKIELLCNIFMIIGGIMCGLMAFVCVQVITKTVRERKENML